MDTYVRIVRNIISSCPICSLTLNVSDIREISIGLATGNLIETLLQTLLQNTSWESIISQCELISKSSAYAVQFVNFQLHQELLQNLKEKANYQKLYLDQSNLIVSDVVEKYF